MIETVILLIAARIAGAAARAIAREVGGETAGKIAGTAASILTVVIGGGGIPTDDLGSSSGDA